jgi:hypothetical protein
MQPSSVRDESIVAGQRGFASYNQANSGGHPTSEMIGVVSGSSLYRRRKPCRGRSPCSAAVALLAIKTQHAPAPVWRSAHHIEEAVLRGDSGRMGCIDGGCGTQRPARALARTGRLHSSIRAAIADA